MGGHRPRRADDVAPRLRQPRPALPAPLPGSGRRWRTGVGDGQRGHRPAVRPSERERRRGPVHARPSRLQLVRPRRDGPHRARRAGRARVRGAGGARDRRGRGRRARRSAPGRWRCASSSSRSCARASPRRCPATTAIAMACSTSTPTCPTSGWRSGAPTTTASWRPCSMAPIPAIGPSSIASWPAAGGRGCGCPRTAMRSAGRNRSPTCVARATCRCSSSPVSTPTTWPPRWTRSSPISRTASSPSISRPSSTARPGRRRTTPSRSSTGACPASTSRPTGTCTSRSCGRAAAGRPASGSTRRGDRRPTARTSSSSTGATPSTTPIAAAPGDWREGGIVRAGHDFNNPLVARAFDAHPGRLPATAGFLEVEPASVVLTVLKPGGDPQARMAGMELDPAHGIALRLYESSGRPDPGDDPEPVADRGRRPDEPARGGRPGDARASGTTIEVRLEPYEIVTLAATLEATAEPGGGAVDLAPRGEAAQPVFSDYWLHNKGAAPMGYQSVTVQIKPSFLGGEGPFDVPIVVASERTDEAAAGSVALIVPPGWVAEPAERIYRLAPGADLAFEASVRAAPGAAPGRYFLAARITDEAGQTPRGRGDRRLPAGRRWHGPQGRRRRALGRARLGGRAGAHDGRYRARAGHVRAWQERRTTGVARSRSSCWTARSRRHRAAAPRSACRSRTRPPARSAARPRS